MRQAALLLSLLFALPLFAQQPVFRNATVTTVRAGDLLSQVESFTGWTAWSRPMTHGKTIFCGSGWNHDGDSITITDDDRYASALVVLARAEEGKVVQVRVSSPECTFNAEGRAVRWVEGVSEQESARVVTAIIDRGASEAAKKALTALAMHADPVDTLLRIAKNDRRSKVRSQALFWLSQRAGAKAAAALRDAVDSDPESEVRAKAVFGISQLPNDQSIPMLAELMRTHRDRQVRKKAAFWLGQKDDPRALEILERFLRE